MTTPRSAVAGSALPTSHLLLALAVVAVWGSNFVVIKLALGHLPPLLFAALRFAFAWMPAALLLRRPPVRWALLAGYGGFIGAGQFGLLYLAMRHDISPGLASLVIQMQVFFTIGLAMLLKGERLRAFQGVALVIGVAGIALIAVEGGGSATPRGLVMVLVAAFCWACGNTLSRRVQPADMLAFVVWSSVFSFVPLAALSLVVDGVDVIVSGLRDADAGTWAAVLWQSLGNTLFGYAAWGWLLSRHPAAAVAPMALLVPVFGIASAALVLQEPLPAWKLAAAGLVLGSLALNLWWPSLKSRLVVQRTV